MRWLLRSPHPISDFFLRFIFPLSGAFFAAFLALFRDYLFVSGHLLERILLLALGFPVVVVSGVVISRLCDGAVRHLAVAMKEWLARRLVAVAEVRGVQREMLRHVDNQEKFVAWVGNELPEYRDLQYLEEIRLHVLDTVLQGRRTRP